MKANEPITIGSGFSYSFFAWRPDRDLNPHLKNMPDISPAGIILWRDGEPVGQCWFELEETRALSGIPHLWELHSLKPLHLEPSIQTNTLQNGLLVPQYHGYIRDDEWVWA